MLLHSNIMRILILLTFLMQVLAPFAVAAATPDLRESANNGDNNQSYGAKVLICSGSGLKWVAVDSDAPLPASNIALKCPLCVVAAANSDDYLPNVGLLVLHLRQHDAYAFVPAEQESAKPMLWHGLRACRAPPFISAS